MKIRFINSVKARRRSKEGELKTRGERLLRHADLNRTARE